MQESKIILYDMRIRNDNITSFTSAKFDIIEL